MTPIKDKQRTKLSERAEEKGNTVSIPRLGLVLSKWKQYFLDYLEIIALQIR